MPILELPPNPAKMNDPNRTSDSDGTTEFQADDTAGQAIKIPTGRYGNLEQHEIVHLLDSLDDERARARFRESIYISVIVYLALAWFLVYGPRVLFHQPEFQNPIALMKEHDKELTYITPQNIPAPKAMRPVLDSKTLKALQQEAKISGPKAVTVPEAPQPIRQAQPQQEMARTTVPPVPEPPLPSAPSAPKPMVEAPLPSAPRPNFARIVPSSARDAIRRATQGAMSGGGSYGSAQEASSGPLQAGAQILSDTQGVDFSAYMRQLHDDIQRNWDPLIPEEVQPPIMKRGIVGIRFTILPGGQIGSMTLETRSGDVALDRAAWSAITSEGNFPPLPRAFHGPFLELRVGFFYNTQIQQ